MTAPTSRPVVVGIDGSESALAAARWGAVEARRRNAPLRLVTAFAWTRNRDLVAGAPELGEQYRSDLRVHAERQLADAVAVAERTVPDRPVDGSVVVGSPIGALGEEARHAQLLVLGSRGRGGLTGLLIGSVAVALAPKAACPVVVVRGEDREPGNSAPVVLGVDDSPAGDAAIAFAFEAAAARGAPLVAVHAWLEHIYDAQIALMVDAAGTEEQVRSTLARRLAGWTQKYPTVPLTLDVARDAPARALVERSRDAQLVVVGSRGHGNLAGLVLGSVSHALLQHSHCPVAVVRR
ncbi:universal stress protein [Pseudonocardia humida]|uniref:Universal stress protein n=1 Tax=Pseudonocardia humida TaxID=2800819 RepID=A0ABT1A023_9PSEU|nr:universal stress protein [Pseudonocardia humida]MCO1656336.1 universal stress protein [Pseudonocardia humida]